MPLHALRLLTPMVFLLALAASGLVPCAAEEFPLASPLRFERHAVVSQSALASEVGARVLDDGGNAADAAVATAFALAVVHPEAGNIGGGGFLLAWSPGGGATCFDFREAAPLGATSGMFLGADGKYDPRRHHEGALSVGVPGSVAGLHLAHRRLGKLPWARLVQPAVDLAAKGFPVSRGLADSLRETLHRMEPYPASVAQFTRGGERLLPGDLLVQADLARTLERIRDRGPDGFYRGETADLLLREMERLGGRMRREDLERYRAVERKPLRGTYRGFEIVAMPPPSSGGVAIIEMLNVLEGWDLSALGPRGSRETHLVVEAMRRAFADRARWLGDPDATEMPRETLTETPTEIPAGTPMATTVERLTSKEHAAALRRTVSPVRASKSSPDSFEWAIESGQTTHISVVDSELLSVALTTTLEGNYGSGIVVPGAGFLLNNEMGDFNAGPGLTTGEGLIGTAPNLAGPGKRMLSSMSPTIVLGREGGWPLLVVGSPGGRTIISTVLLVLLGVLDQGLSIQDAVDRPRYHHPWLPDRILAEPGCFCPDTRAALEALGHRIEPHRGPQGSVMGILVGRKAWPGSHWLEAGVDRRRPDGGAAGR